MTSPVNTSASEPLLGSGANALYVKALETLRLKVRADRAGAWREIAPSVPDIGGELRSHLKELAALTRPRKSRLHKQKPSADPKLCKGCHWPLPHADYESRARHGHYTRLIRARRNRWAKYPDPKERTSQTALAARTFLAAHQDRWVAALLEYDPLGTQHLLATQGRQAVIERFRRFNWRWRKKLLARIPPRTKRLYKGELLVRSGERAYRPPKGKAYPK